MSGSSNVSVKEVEEASAQGPRMSARKYGERESTRRCRGYVFPSAVTATSLNSRSSHPRERTCAESPPDAEFAGDAASNDPPLERPGAGDAPSLRAVVAGGGTSDGGGASSRAKRDASSGPDITKREARATRRRVRDGGVTTKRRILRHALDDQQHVLCCCAGGARLVIVANTT